MWKWLWSGVGGVSWEIFEESNSKSLDSLEQTLKKEYAGSSAAREDSGKSGENATENNRKQDPFYKASECLANPVWSYRESRP